MHALKSQAKGKGGINTTVRDGLGLILGESEEKLKWTSSM
jgi:hypothetical protein